MEDEDGVSAGLRDARIKLWKDLLEGAGGKRLLIAQETVSRQRAANKTLKDQHLRAQAIIVKLDSALEIVKRQRDDLQDRLDQLIEETTVLMEES